MARGRRGGRPACQQHRAGTHGGDPRQLGLKEGDAAFFVAGDPDKFWKFAGLARTKIGDELNLIDKDRFELAWIVDFPMYEYSEEDKKVDFSHNPFSMPQGGLEALADQDPLTIKAFQYDIICNGYEIASGGIRNHRPEAMVKAFEIAGYGEKDVVERFGGMYRAFQYGAPPHGGMAAGVDRIVMLALRHHQPARDLAVPDEPARRGPPDGRARRSRRSSCASFTSGSICRKPDPRATEALNSGLRSPRGKFMASHSEDLQSAALAYHRLPRPGKLEIQAIKPLANQRDLALAYSPGVAAACMAIAADPPEAAR